MDIYSFLNSRDVAAHCREINKVWNAFEMAVIIARSSCPMADKHAAWRELIADSPDMATLANMHYKSYDSLHRKLTELVDYEERALELIKNPVPGAVYMYSISLNDERNYNETNYIFSTYETALTKARDSWERDDVLNIKIEKLYVNDAVGDADKGRIEVITDYDGKEYSISILGVNEAGLFPDIAIDDLLTRLDDLFYLDIPVPFKRGDILIAQSGIWGKSDAFVLDWLDLDDKERLAQRLSGEGFGDGSDMIGWGFFTDSDGVLYGDHTACYDCLEYYRGNLTGKEEILHYVNLFIKGEIDLPDLLAMQCRAVFEHKLDNGFRIDIHGRHISERHLAENRPAFGEKEANGLMPWVADKLSIIQVEFLAKESGIDDTESVQTLLSDGGGQFMGMCAGIVHEENHYEKTNDGKFNSSRKDMARLILERYGHKEDGWINEYAESDQGETV